MNPTKAPTKLVVDSTADLPPEWLARWQIPIIPAFVNFGAESYPDDGVALPRAEFYRRLAHANPLPTTSAPPPGLAQEVLRRALEQAEQVVVFAVASQYSSIYNTIRLAAQQVDPTRITVVDSGSVSMGMGWQVVAAAEAMQRGAGPAEMLAAAHDVRERTEVWAVPDTLEYLRRGGRVNALVAGVGTLLQIKPVIALKNSVVSTVQRARTMPKAIHAIEALVRGAAPLERLALLYASIPDSVEKLRADLADIAPPDQTVMIDVNTALGTHFGPGAFGVALVRKRPSP